MARLGELSAARLRYAAAILALAGIWLLMLLFGRGPLDRNIYDALYAGGHPVLISIARVVTGVGQSLVLILAGVALTLWLWYVGQWRRGLVLLVVMLVGRGLEELQKMWIARARPTLEPHLVIVKTWSFPSGHATNSMIVCLTLALALTGNTHWRRIAVVGAILVSLLIGLSRVMLGVHWPSDVIGGWSFGLLWVLLTLPRTERLFAEDSGTAAKRL